MKQKHSSRTVWDVIFKEKNTIACIEGGRLLLPKNANILKAWWGVPDLQRGILCDYSKIKNGMIADNKNLGIQFDPVPGRVKILVVTYSGEGRVVGQCGNQQNGFACIEGYKLILPENINITKAWYGVPGIKGVSTNHDNIKNGMIVNNETMGINDPVSGKRKTLIVTYEGNYEKVVIVTSPILKLGVANNIKKHITQIFKNTVDVEIITEFPFENKDDYLYIFLYFYNIFDVDKYPDNYIVWQIEQLTSNNQKAWKMTQEKINVLDKAINIFEISMKNYDFNNYDSNIKRDKICYTPLPFYNEKNNISFNEKNIDCVFFGTPNIRRNNINNYIKKELNKHDITFHFLYSVFDKELTDVLKKTKYVINLHYYDKPCLEGARINIAIENNCLTISEDVFDDDRTRNLYKDYVIYNPCIKEDLSNIDIFINSIIHNLKPEIYRKNIINFNKKEILSVRFENMLEKNLLNCIKNSSPKYLRQQKHFIVNNNLAGGSYKWQKDIEKDISLFRIYNFDMFLKILQNHDNPKNMIVLINSFIKTDITIDKILFLHDKYKFKIILPIHEWFWFNVTTNYDNKYHNIYLNEDMKLNENSKKIFNICSKIICPSKFVYEILYKHYPHEKIKQINWIDYDLLNTYNNYKIKKDTQINIGVLSYISECKGKEQLQLLIHKYRKNSNINFLIVGHNIEYYDDDYSSFINLIKKHNIHGLLYLNKWGETWCYSLSKALYSGLPIFYNNIGSFKERIPKNIDKYIINNNDESEFYAKNMLNRNFNKFVKYIQNNDIFVNDKKPTIVKNSKLIQELEECEKKQSSSAQYPLIHMPLFNNKIIEKREKIKKYAIYFPQFHKIKENDINFYENYTDIINLKMLQYKNKETPNKKILNLKNIEDYDLSNNKELINKQIELLEKYNIDGFAMYYYWFSKNTITNKNDIMYNIHKRFLNSNLGGKKIFFVWANENWSDNPAFGNSEHIIKNDYTDENLYKHASFLMDAFKNVNYLKNNNKPVFLIHHPWFIHNDLIDKFTKILNDKCIENGFNGIELKLNNMVEMHKNGYNFHPNYKKTKTIKVINNKIVLDYKSYVENEVNVNSKVNTIFFDFDNRARLTKPNRLNQATICINNNEEMFIKYLKKIKNSNTEILLINAWNEWGERMHIEPSEEKGDYYLNLINRYI